MIFMILGQDLAKLSWIDGLYLLRSRWPLVLLIGSMVWLAGAAVRSQHSPSYELSVSLQFPPPVDGTLPYATGRSPSPQDSLATLAQARAELCSATLLSEVLSSDEFAKAWQIPDTEENRRRLAERLRVGVDPARRQVTVTLRERDRELAAAIAGALTERYLEKDRAASQSLAHARVQQLERERQEIIRRIDRLEVEGDTPPAATDEARREAGRPTPGERLASEKQRLLALEAQRRVALQEWKEAEPRAQLLTPVSAEAAIAITPPHLRLPVIGLLGIVLGLAFALSRPARAMRWSTLAELMQQLDVPVVGLAPLTGKAAIGQEGEAIHQLLEPYRDWRNRLLRLPTGDCALFTLMPVQGAEPISEAVANLACVLADAGKATLLIDADFRQPTLHRHFDAAQHPGLSDYLSGEMRLEETVVRSRHANLWFMPTGPLHADPGCLLNGRRMSDLLWELKRRFDVVLLVSPSIHEISDAGILAGLADYTLLGTPYWGHSLRQLRETKTALETLGAACGGVFLTLHGKPLLTKSPPSRTKTRGSAPAVEEVVRPSASR